MQWLFLCTLAVTTAVGPLSTYSLIFLIAICAYNVSLQKWINVSNRHFYIAQASLSIDFLSYYIFPPEILRHGVYCCDNGDIANTAYALEAL